jgi:hypothetical protein
MAINTNEKKGFDKLVKDTPVVTLDVPLPETTPTKKRSYRIRRVAEPHIRRHVVRGRKYYTYCRGVDKEVYLGTAESILGAVLKMRHESGSGMPSRRGIVPS